MFELVLKNENGSKFKWFFITVIALNLLAFLYFFLTDKVSMLHFFIAVVLVILALVIEILMKKKLGNISLLVLCCMWVTTPYFYVAIVPLLFWLYHYDLTRDKKIIFKKDSITSPTIFKQHSSWKEYENIVLKDGLLTLDYKNNKLLQVYISPTSEAINEKDFNEFCYQQIKNNYH